jgi:hypothetical protein
MFPLTLLDHIRLTFGGVVHNYKAHSTLASRLTRRLWQIRIGELVLLGGALASAIAGTLRGDTRYTLLAAILTGAALAVFTFYLAVNLESRIYAHRWCASRLWLVRERYRALLSEMRDEMLPLETVRERRDQLLIDLHAIVEQAPLVDRPAYQSAREALAVTADTALSDEEIEWFLPDSLRKDLSARPSGTEAAATGAR